MFIVALTGGIGSGKSEAANAFSDLGVPIVDLDVISHKLTSSNQPLMSQIAASFGQSYVTKDGALDRNRMRQLVFSHPESLAQLNAILHPAIYEEAIKQLQSFKSAPYTVLVIPLLDKAGVYTSLISRVLVIDCDEETQIQRVKLRSALDEAQIKEIIRAQTPRYARLAMADDVIENSGNIKVLSQAVKKLHQKYLKTCI